MTDHTWQIILCNHLALPPYHYREKVESYSGVTAAV